MSQRVIVTDDEELIRWSLGEHLRGEGYEVEEAKDGLELIKLCETRVPDAILLDLKMPRLDGLGALRRLRELDIQVPVIVLTAHGAVESAVEATQLGAAAYLSKPFDLREVCLQLDAALEKSRMAHEIRYHRDRHRTGYGKLKGESPAMERVFDILKKLESVDAPTVLVMGESGTGKDLVAQAIHGLGPRAQGPFMEVDCASLPEHLIESTLFGHEKGSFTDARSLKRGLFEVAKGGTIFLDEIGEMALGTQAKLLRALESRRFKRVGGVGNLPLDASVIAATNRDLRAAVQEGRFREDLFFRLNIIPIQVPALRDRAGDVPILVDHFLSQFALTMGKGVEGVSQEALEAMRAYPWPGNVRELRNVIERIVILEAGVETIRLEHLPFEIRARRGGALGALGAGASFILPEGGVDLEDVEKSLIIQALERCSGNQSASARLLGLTRYALRYRMEKYALL